MKFSNLVLLLCSILFEIIFLLSDLFGFTFLAGIFLGEFLSRILLNNLNKKQPSRKESWASQFLVTKSESEHDSTECD